MIIQSKHANYANKATVYYSPTKFGSELNGQDGRILSKLYTIMQLYMEYTPPEVKNRLYGQDGRKKCVWLF